jgi:hypothetical protein
MIQHLFRDDPDIRPNGKLSIIGEPRCDEVQMHAYAIRRNPKAPNVAGIYLDKSAKYGIRGDVAYCQAMLDTQAWTTEPLGPPVKPYAYAIWGGQVGEWTMAELERRTERHVQLLYALLAQMRTVVPCWEDLNGKWTIPGHQYGQDIVSIWRNMRTWKKTETDQM